MFDFHSVHEVPFTFLSHLTVFCESGILKLTIITVLGLICGFFLVLFGFMDLGCVCGGGCLKCDFVLLIIVRLVLTK